MATTKISVQQLSDELFKLVGRNYLFVSKDVVTFNATSIDLSKANFTNAEGLEPEWKEVNRAAFAFVIDTSNNVIVAIANITAVDSTNNVISIIVKAREDSLVYKGEVADRAHLPTTGMATGDTYYIQDEASTTYYNGTNWIDMSGDKSSFIWKCSTDLASSVTTQVTVPLANLTRVDDNTVVPTSRDMIIGKTIIYSNDGYIGTVIALAGTTGVIVTRITKDTKSDGIYNTSDVISNDVGDTTELDVNNITNIDLDKVVLNETLIYDDAGTLAKVTAIDTTNDTVTVTTITKVSVEPSDGTYKTTDTISTTIDATTVLDVTNIAGLVLAKVVINETQIYDASGTVAIVTAIDDTNNEITVKTITISDGETIQVETLPTASATEEDKIYQYIGATTSTLTNGHFYKCVSDGEDPATYSWEEIKYSAEISENETNAITLLNDKMYTRKVQLETLPTDKEEYEGMLVQYIGTTTANYTNGYFYKCQEVAGSDPKEYEWIQSLTQEQEDGVPHWSGTRAEYEVVKDTLPVGTYVSFTDDYDEGLEVVDVVEEDNMNPVTSNAVYEFVKPPLEQTMSVDVTKGEGEVICELTAQEDGMYMVIFCAYITHNNTGNYTYLITTTQNGLYNYQVHLPDTGLWQTYVGYLGLRKNEKAQIKCLSGLGNYQATYHGSYRMIKFAELPA